MKRSLIIIALLAIPFMAMAQIKVLEKNPKKAPAWTTAAVSDHFISSAIAGSLEEAKAQALEDVKRQIISAVAENIKSSTSQTTSQSTSQNEIVDFLESFDSNFETRSAILPFINGISMSKVKGFYYEKRQDKATGIISYSYTILYPFTNSELHVLIKKFLALDAEMEGKLNEQIAKIETISTTEEIDRGIAALEPLLEYFFDDVRISKTKQAIDQYKKLYSYITLDLANSSPGEMVYAMLLEGRPISTAIKPTFRSNCAMGLMYNDMGDGMVKITYDSEGCLDEENNYIEISYRVPYYPIKKMLYPTMTISPLRITSSGEMAIKMIIPEPEGKDGEASTTEVEGLEIEFQLDNRSTSPGLLTSFTLQIGEFSSTINISGLDIEVSQGVSQIIIPYEKSLKLKEIKNSQRFSSLSFTKGSVSIKNPLNGQVQTVPIVVKYTIE